MGKNEGKVFEKRSEKEGLMGFVALLALLSRQSTTTVRVLPAKKWPELPSGFTHAKRHVPQVSFVGGTFYLFDESHLGKKPWSHAAIAETAKKARLFDEGRMKLVGLKKHRFVRPFSDLHALECFSHYMRDQGMTFLCHHEVRSCLKTNPGLLEPNELLVVPYAPFQGLPLAQWDFYLPPGGERFFYPDALPRARSRDVFWTFLTCAERKYF